MDPDILEDHLTHIEDKLIFLDRKNDHRMTLICEGDNSYDINKYLFEACGLRFAIATGIDSDDGFEILYHFSHDASGALVTVKAKIRDREHPQIRSITGFLPAAEWIEREIHDMLGIIFDGHPNLKRLVLADDWPEGIYPHRKEAKHEEVPQ